MTPVFCCGFECGQIGTAGQHWGANAGAPSISTSTVRSGTRSLRINPTVVAMMAESLPLSAPGVIVVRAYVRFTTLPTGDCSILRLDTDAVPGGVFFKSSTSELVCGTTTSNLGSTGVSVTTGQWYLVDVRYNNTASPILIDAKVDGASCSQVSLAGSLA